MSARGSINYRIRAEKKGSGSKKPIERSSSKSLEPVFPDADAPLGFIRSGAGMTLSKGFNSVRVDIAVEVPWPMRLGKKKDVKDGIAYAEELVDECLTERTGELSTLLDELEKS